MCGIVGYISTTPAIDRSWLVKARDIMVHRGPDDAGEWWSEDGCVGLAHRRLSILDLSPLGHQPMLQDKFGLVTVFNGEIYNHRELRKELEAKGYKFCSQSDTEVLLAAYVTWGETCLSYLNGMFAFAIYDEERKSLFVARDRVGEKPLFYHLDEKTGSLSFASELKALLAKPQSSRCIDEDALDCYLAFGFVPGERCILKGYNKLPAAHALRFDLSTGKAKTWQYWSIPEIHNHSNVTCEDTILLDELDRLLEESVSRQMVADVPVGVLLSGGVDSSLITAMAARNSSKVHTFTIGFPGHGDHDETSHARLIADYFGTDHTELMAEPTTADLIPRLVEQFDEPMVDSSMIPMWLVSHLVRQHCTVALGGDGGDELFGGYPHYSRLLWLQKYGSFLPSFSRKTIAKCAESLLPLGFAKSNIRSWLMVAGEDLSLYLPMYAGLFDRYTRQKLMGNIRDLRFMAEFIHEANVPSQPDLLQRATRMDFHNYLAEDILVKIDRASMLNSLEIRAPMLDYHLIEFAFKRVASHLKATSKDRKILLKKLAARILPSEFNIHRKQGFSIPLSEWLKSGPFRDLFWETLNCQDSIFDRKTVLDLLKGEEHGRNNGERLFALVQFELWRKHYGASI